MNLLKTASTVSFFTLLSRVTGLVREQIMAASFGASALTDAFNVAFRIPNLLRRLFAEGAFSQAFVPILAATRGKEGDDATRLLIDAVASVLFWALLVTVVIGVAAAPVLVWLMASGLAAFDEAVFMTRLMFPYIGFMSLVALAAGVLNTWRQFAVPAAIPVLLNLSWIAAAWWLSPYFQSQGVQPIYALAVGVLVGGLSQLLAVGWALRRLGLLPRVAMTPSRIAMAWGHDKVQTLLRNMAPALLGVGVAQISLLINTQIASHLAEGAVSWLTYADRLMEFPTALLGVALGVVLTPQLAAAQSRGDATSYAGLLDWGLRLTLLLALPCAAALVVFADPLVAVLYHYGKFQAQDVGKTALAVMGWGVGLLGLVGVKILAPGYFARQDVRTPVKIAVFVLVFTQVLNLLLVPRLGHAALALSIGLGALLNALWLWRGLCKLGVYQAGPGWWGLAVRAVAATAAMSALLWWAGRHFDWIGLQAQPLQRVGWMGLVLCGSVLLYFAVLLVCGLNLKQFARRGH